MAKINKKSIVIDRNRRRAQNAANSNGKHEKFCKIVLKNLTNDDILELNQQIKVSNVANKRISITKKRRSILNSGAKAKMEFPVKRKMEILKKTRD